MSTNSFNSPLPGTRSVPVSSSGEPFGAPCLVNVNVLKKGGSMSLQTVDLALVQAYLHNVQVALVNDQLQHAASLLDHALSLLGQPVAAQGSVAPHLPLHFDVGIGLDTGLKRKMQPNEDCTFAVQGVRDLAGEEQGIFGLFVVADGLGGHADGQQASHLATETLVDNVFPQLQEQQECGASLQALLIEGVQHANEVVYQRNQERASQRGDMGTTITTVLIAGSEAHIANVGDSRTYLFRSGMGLRQLTRDHSLVAQMVLDGDLHADDIYTHPQRHVITRGLGAAPWIEIDVFAEQIQDGDVFLLCSDGLWEMVRDAALARVLFSSWLTAQQMAETLVQLALQGGGLDNIGLIVVQVHLNVEEIETDALPLMEYALLAS